MNVGRILDVGNASWFNEVMNAPHNRVLMSLAISSAMSVLVASCGSAATGASNAAGRSTEGSGASTGAETRGRGAYTGPRNSTGSITRSELLPVLDAGLGRFLGGVLTEPSLVGGAFTGWRIVELFPGDERFEAVDLLPGDVVTQVNGQAIERPEQAFAVWNGLRIAEELHVAYTRDGAPRELRFQIAEAAP